MVTSQLTYLPTGWHNHSRPFQYVAEALNAYATPAASPVMIVCPLIDDVTLNFENQITKVYGDNSTTYFKPLLLGKRYNWTAKIAPADIVLQLLCTKKPNYAAITDNLASSLYFLRSWLQSVGAYSFTEHFQGYAGSRCTNWDLVINGARVDITIAMVSQLITKPNATNPLTTPTMKAFSDITSIGFSNIDGGSLPLTVNSIAYPQENFHANVNNHMINGSGRAYNGSMVLDNNHIFKQDFSGDYIVPVGKDLNLEGHFDNVALSSVPMVYAVKPATMTITITEADHKTLSVAQSASSDDEWKLNLAFDCKNLVLS